MPTETTHRASHARPLRGDIEGLRAVAVAMVLLYHVGVPGFSGGFAGVDVFFVISGYLITSQLVNEARRTGRISLTRFYARRARRLLPAASLVLILTGLAGYWLLPRGRYAELGTDLLASTAYLVNWVLARREVDYLAEDSAPSLLQHYWSLAVEEQFYLIWPLLIIGILWVCRGQDTRFHRLLTAVLLTAIILSFAYSVIHTASSPGTAYFITTTRAWQLGIGALLVLVTPVLSRLREDLAAPLAWAGLALIAATIVTISTATPWPGSAAALPTLGVAAVIAAGITASNNSAARALGIPLMRFLGGISYGLYLWHWPALQLLKETNPDASMALRLAVAAGCIGAAWLTLHLVENPIRFNPRLSARPAPALGMAATAMTASAALGAAVLVSAPKLDTTIPAEAGAISLVDPNSRFTPELKLIDNPESRYTKTGEVVPDPAVAVKDTPKAAYATDCQVPPGSTEIAGPDECWFGDPEGETTVAMLGDSKMLQWLPALDSIARSEGWRLKVYTKSGCGFSNVEMSEDCGEYNTKLSQYLTGEQHTPDLILTSLVRSGDNQAIADSMAENLRPVMTAGAKVAMVADNPAPNGADLPAGQKSYECVDASDQDYAACSYANDPGRGTPVLELAAEQLDAPVINVNEWICPGGKNATCPTVIDHTLLFRQGSHLTASYIRTLAPILHHEMVVRGVASRDLVDIEWNSAPADAGSSP